jgi:hypothetical protein
MKHHHCLNCGKSVNDKFCSACGQKSDTHRLSFKHFIAHDVLHGTFHLEKGMLFTAKQALIRPGKAALDYIAGKRVSYYNIFYFILLLMGLSVVLKYYYNKISLSIDPDRALQMKVNEAGQTISDILSSYGKFFTFAIVPVVALNSLLIFKRKKLNYSEHSMISGVLLLGLLLIIVFVLVISFFEFLGISTTLFDFIHINFKYVLLIYTIYVYYDAFRSDYSLLGFSYRLILFLLLFSAEALLFLFMIIGIATGWQSESNIELSF